MQGRGFCHTRLLHACLCRCCWLFKSRIALSCLETDGVISARHSNGGELCWRGRSGRCAASGAMATSRARLMAVVIAVMPSIRCCLMVSTLCNGVRSSLHIRSTT